MPNWREGGVRWLWLTAACLLLDQVTKIWVAGQFQLYDSVSLLPHLNLTYVHNQGAAFSFLSEAGGWQRWLFSLIAVTVSLILVVMLVKNPRQQRLLNAAYALVIGGAIGNLIDRLSYGYVIDFIDFYINNWHWPAFNVADVAICIGAGLLILDSFTGSSQTDSSEQSNSQG